MLKKFLSKLGIGSANINLVLPQSKARLGESIRGEFLIEGGAVEQHINKIDVELRLTLHQNGQVQTQTVAVIPVASAFALQAGEKKTLPFAYELPYTLPISRNGVRYAFVTRLDIAGGLDHLDEDAIDILPPLCLEKLFVAFEKLGFREKTTSGELQPYGQQFAFFPTEPFQRTVQEVELLASLEKEGLRLFLEVDVYAGAFGLREQELKREVFFTHEQLRDVTALAEQLRAIIQEMTEQPHPYTTSPYKAQYSRNFHMHGRASGMIGAIGGFAAGLFAGMLMEEVIDEAMEGALGFDEEASGEGDSFFDDLFGEEDGEF